MNSIRSDFFVCGSNKMEKEMRAFDIKKAGERLRALRIDAGLGLKEIAEEFYLSSKSVVYCYEHGRRGIPLDVVAMYSDKFGVTTDWILLGVTPKYRVELASDAVEDFSELKVLFMKFDSRKMKTAAIEQLRVLKNMADLE